MLCFCGCDERAKRRHHVIYQQELKRVQRQRTRRGPDPVKALDLLWDDRNLVLVDDFCHAQHHNRIRPYDLARLPDSVFAFAAEVLGRGKAYEYLRRRYAGPDARLDALVLEAAA